MEGSEDRRMEFTICGLFDHIVAIRAKDLRKGGMIDEIGTQRGIDFRTQRKVGLRIVTLLSHTFSLSASVFKVYLPAIDE